MGERSLGYFFQINKELPFLEQHYTLPYCLFSLCTSNFVVVVRVVLASGLLAGSSMMITCNERNCFDRIQIKSFIIGCLPSFLLSMDDQT